MPEQDTPGHQRVRRLPLSDLAQGASDGAAGRRRRRDANGAALASDGGFLVTQNGGFDFAATGLFDDPPPHRPAVPGLQRAATDGTVAYVTDEPLQAPNDLVVAADGTVFFTDPGSFPPPEDPIARGRRSGNRPLT